MNYTKHIAIIGAGLIGCMLAIYLRRRGYKISVFERRQDPRKFSMDSGRSINLALSNRGIRALKDIGIVDSLTDLAIPMHGRMIHDLNGKLRFQPYGKEGEFINSVSRGGLNILLLKEAEKEGVEFQFDSQCHAVDLEKTILTFRHTNRPNSNQKFDHVVGSDGAFSAIRAAMQVTDRFDYSQHFIEHGYKELTIPPALGKKLEKNALHIWPRESFMLIALPNPDESFTCTFFFPYTGQQSFQSLKTSHDIKNFFEEVFPDAIPLLPTLIQDFNENPTSSLVTIRCYPWSRNNMILIGDAAHAVLPFYGQGMNCGFEDCRVLNELLDKHHDDWEVVMKEFEELRKPDTDAIAQLALENFVEMRDWVAEEDFLLRKKIEAKLHEKFPNKWIPLYSMVAFMDNIRYSDALAIGKKQQIIMDDVMSDPHIRENWESLDLESIAKRLF